MTARRWWNIQLGRSRMANIDEVRQLVEELKTLGYSSASLADRLRMNDRTLRRIIAGTIDIPPGFAVCLELLLAEERRGRSQGRAQP